MATKSAVTHEVNTPLEVEMWAVVDKALAVVPREVEGVDVDAMRLCMMIRGASNIVFGDLQAVIRDETPFVPSSMNILLIVIVNGELEFTNVAKYANLPKATASSLVESMVTDGILERRVPENDRRVTLLSATDLGRQLFRENFSRYNKREAFWKSALDDAEQATLVALLAKLVNSRVEDSVFARKA